MGNKRTAPKTIRKDEAGDLFRYGFDGGKDTDKRDEALCLLMYRAGLRVGEACALEADSIDFTTGHIRIPNGDGCKSGARSTYMDTSDTALVGTLLEWLGIRAAWRVESALLFCTRNGRHLHPDSVYRSLVTRSEAAIAKKVTPHMLRHSFATERLGEGWDLLTLQQALGHQSLSTTLMYLHANPVSVRDAWKRCHESVGFASA